MASARIARITAATEERPVSEPFVTALREVRRLEVVALALALDDGTLGRAEVVPTPRITGETSASIVAALEGPIAAAVLGHEVDDAAALQRAAAAALVGNTTAKCALDLALFDAAAARAGSDLPVLLGTTATRVRTDMTLSLASAAEMARAAVRHRAQGFEVLKIKVGLDPAEDVARVAAVAAATGARLRLDANQGWSRRDALFVLDALAEREVDIELVEQPLAAHDLDGMARVRAASPWPLLADESVHDARDVVRVAAHEAADIVNVKLAKCGGLRAALEVVAVARSHGLEVIVGCMLEPPATVRAAAALAAAVAPDAVHDLDAGRWSGTSAAFSYDPPWAVFGR